MVGGWWRFRPDSFWLGVKVGFLVGFLVLMAVWGGQVWVVC